MIFKQCKIWLFLFGSTILSAVSNGELSATRREYLSVFKNIPRLFEYLLETLEERPEILEKNDVIIFKRNAEYEDDDDFQNDVEDAYYNNEIGNSDNDYEIDDNNKENDEALNGEDLNEEISSEIDLNTEYFGPRSGENSLDEDKASFEYADYNIKTLTPEEVAEQAIKVEEMLLDYNSSN